MSISREAFVEFSPSVKNIQTLAFYDNITLKKVVIPDELRLKTDLDKTFPSGTIYLIKS